MSAIILPDDYIVLDIETTGFANNCDIIEIAAVRVRNNEITEQFQSFIKPSAPIPANITELTGITNDMTVNAPAFEQLFDDFIKFIGNDVLIGHNIKSFDMRMISNKALELCGTVIENELIDTLILSKQLLPIKHHTLADLCSYYNVENNTAHRALSDVLATNECYQHLKNGDMNNNFIETDVKRNTYISSHHTEESKALQNLQCVLKKVTDDNILTEDEVISVRNWLEENKYLSGNYPFDIAYSEIEKALEDNILEVSELNSLLNTFVKLIDPVANRSCQCSSFDLNGMKVCLSGEFSHGTKSEISQLLESLGAEMSNNVTKKVGMLIVGDIGSEAWLCGNYGGKVKKAVEMQEKGANITIISETDFYKGLEIT